MISRFRTGSRPIILKIVVVFLMIMAPIVGAGVYINDFASRSMFDEISQSMGSKLEFYMKLLEAELEKVIKFQQQFVNDADLLELSGGWEFMSFPERAYAARRLQQRLLLLQSSSLYIKTVSVYLPTMDRTISTDNLYTNFDEGLFRKLLPSGFDISHFAYADGRLFINMTSPGWVRGDAVDPIYMISIELSVPKMQEMLNEINIDGEGTAELVGGADDWSVASSAGEFVRTEHRFVSNAIRSPNLNLTLRAYVPETVAYGKLQRYKMGYWLMSGLGVVAALVFSVWIHRIIHKPLNKLVRAFRLLEEGNLTVAATHHAEDEFRYVFAQFNRTVKKLDALMKDIYEQKYRSQLSEFRQLQSQINPHFLYNSFFNLHLMVELKDMDTIKRYTSYLGEYFMYITRTASNDVSLLDEADHARKYAQIQSFRFKDRIVVDMEECPAVCADIRVPRLILQPMIENAYKHALEGKRERGLLRVRFDVGPDAVTVAVEDNGESLTDRLIGELNESLRDDNMETETTGLINVSRRLQLAFGHRAGLTVGRSPLGGMRVAIALPCDGSPIRLGDGERRHV